MDSPHLELKRAAREIDALLTNGQTVLHEHRKRLADALAADGGRNTDELAPLTVTIIVTPRANQSVFPVVAETLELVEPVLLAGSR